MKQLQINVTDNQIFINEPIDINTGEYRVTTVNFTFPIGWEGLIKKAKFGEYEETLVNNSCYFPIILRSGVVTIKVYGYRETVQSGETAMELVYSPQPTNIRVNQGSYDYTKGDTPVVPGPETEYMDKTILWNGFSLYFSELSGLPQNILDDFDFLQEHLGMMSLAALYANIEILDNKILDFKTGSTGTTDYTELDNKPSINGVTLNGNKTSAQLGINIPDNYVTTDTQQGITAPKAFTLHSENQGVERTQSLELSSSAINYYNEKTDGADYEYNSFIVAFPTENDDGMIEVEKDGEVCDYIPPKFENGETFQIAVTDDIPTDYVTTNTDQNNITGRKAWVYNDVPRVQIDAGTDSYGGSVAVEDANGNTTAIEAGVIRNNGYSQTLPNQSGTFAMLSDIPQSIGDKTYVHTQSSASNTWVIPHNLNKYPSVTVINSADEEVIGDVTYDSLNQVTIQFKGSFKGKATLN